MEFKILFSHYSGKVLDLRENKELTKFLLLKGQFVYTKPNTTIISELNKYSQCPDFIHSVIEEIKQDFEAALLQLAEVISCPTELVPLMAAYEPSLHERYTFLVWHGYIEPRNDFSQILRQE